MSLSVASPELRRLRGELRLRFSTDAQGTPFLKKRFRRGLYHFSKPYREGDRVVLQVLNPTAGLFAGDHLDATITIEDGAQACLLAPSSTQVYNMSRAGRATAEQTIDVGPDSSLVFYPKWSVLHKGARFHQHTRINLDPSASLLFIDQIAAGRRAHGEFLEFAELQNGIQLYRGRQLILKERSVCGQSQRRWFWNRARQPGAFFTTVIAAHPGKSLDVKACSHALIKEKDDQTSLGLSELERGVSVLRTLSSSNRMLAPLLHVFCAFLPSNLSLPEVSNRIN